MSTKKNIPSSTGTSRYEDGDDFWNSKSTFKPFNFDDDDGDDSIETIEWNGATAAPVRFEKSRSMNMQQQSVKQINSGPTSARPTSARVASARQHPRKTFSQSTAIISNSSVKRQDGTLSSVNKTSTSFNEGKSISDMVSVGKPISTTDISKLEAEISSLRRQLIQAKKDRSVAPSCSETLKRFMTGDTSILELYKSREDKSALLNSAIQRRDGNAILAITLFMRNTLKREIFSKELMDQPVAVDHYCAYLRATLETEELHEILTVLGRTEEAAMLKYRQSLKNSRSPELRINSLQDCIKYYFDSDPRLSHETQHIQEQCMLLRKQIVVDDNDRQTQDSATHSIFKTHPRRDSLLHKSLVTTLYYMCYYHWGEAEGLLSSPLSLRMEHKINEKQFIYIAIAALCRMRKWKDLENVLTQEKKLWRSARLHAVIGFDKVVDVLSKNLAPNDVIGKYCAEIDTSDQRLQMAIKHNCHKVAVDTMVYQKDRHALLSYANNKIPDNQLHMKQFAIEQSKRHDIKWKN